MGKSNKDIIGIIRYVEKKLIESNSNYIDYLPVIRVFIYFWYRAGVGEVKNGVVSLYRSEVVVDTLKSIFSLIKLMFVNDNKQYLIVAPAQHRNIQKKGAWESKHLDSLIRSYGSENCRTLEFGKVRINTSPYPNLSNAVRLIGKISYLLKPKNSFLKGLTARVVELLEECDANVNISKERFLDDLHFYQSAQSVYRRIFRRSLFRKSVFIAYYDIEAMAMISVLNEKGLVTADYQHGIQNDYHPLYTGWGALLYYPNCLPRQFLLWDDVSFHRIKKWGSKFGVVPVMTGNLWMENTLKEKNKFLDANCKAAKTILVALQLWPDYFNKNLFDIIEKMPDVIWVFRQHPISNIPAQEISRILIKYPNIRFDSGLDRPLEEAIIECVACLTGFSTVGIEALQFGKKTIFTHINAKEGLMDYIDGDSCIFATEKKELERAVHKVLSV